MRTRRDFLRNTAGLAGAAAGLSLLPRGAGAAEPMVFMTPFGFDPDFIELMNAYSGGHFTRQGFDATVIGGNGTAQAFQQVLAGKAQFARCSGVDFIRGVGGKGMPLIAIGTINQNSGFHIVSLKDRPIRNGADMKGKTIGVLSHGGSTETLVEIILARSGVATSDVKLEVAGNSPGEVELIRRGRIDCFICTYSVLFAIERAGDAIEYWNVDRYAPSPGQIYWTTRDIAEKQPDMAVRVLRALNASALEIMKGPIKPIFERASKDFDIAEIKDIDMLANYTRTAIKELWLTQGRNNLLHNVPKLWQSGVQSLQSIGPLEIKDPSKLYTNAFIDKI